MPPIHAYLIDYYYVTDTDPQTEGLFSPGEAIALRTDEPGIYLKTGAQNTSWTKIGSLGISGIEALQDGNPIAGGPWDTINFIGAELADSGGGTLDVSVSAVTELSGLFGSGVDGAFTFDGVATFNGFGGLAILPIGNTYDLTRDIFLANGSVINAGITIRTKGFRIFCNGTLTVEGTISCNGGAGGNASAGFSTGGAAGTAAYTSGYYVSTAAGVAGANAGAGASNGGSDSGVAPIGSTTGSTAMAANGATLKGGGGGRGFTGFNGGTAPGRANNPATCGAGWESLQTAITGQGQGAQQIGAGSSGGGGGGHNAAVAGGGGGGSGAAGGILGVFARGLVGGGSIEAKGGAGGNGGTGVGTDTGGGGGGSGGIAIVATQTAEFVLTVDVSGGAGGAKNNSGQAGGRGGDGRACIYILG